MRLTFILLIMFGVAQVLSAQTKGTAKLYAFKETVSHGAVPKKTYDENGKEITTETRSGVNYLIYIESDTRVYPSELWIEGQPYSVSVQTVTTPVERMHFSTPADPKKTVLVPATSRKVVQLTPETAVEDKLTDKGRSLSAANEAVVIYKQNGKFYYAVVTSLIQIEPVALQ